ncbi:LysR family transcriptional regulator [Erythrobacter sp.]|jgi:DNA-binding transcriptional LysR family regulator|uniref:LysR family transcriptional regulator n=1 Tax=Erythrobacter sp. TaxID=1042 RepID=UPI002EBE5360|nr:LysR family transcriptional regulator [Erythrobacter sp.]
MDRFKCLEAFVRIVETGSLSHAARSLNISKSTVSERLAQLERLVGEPLLIRSTRKVSATSAGRRIYGEFRATTAHLATLEKATDQQASAIQPLRIASSTDVGATEVARALSAYCKANPNADISLSIGNDLVDPLERGFDIAIHFRRIIHAKLKVEEIAVVECGLYGSPEYLHRAGRPERPEDLRHHKCLGYMFQPSVHDWVPTKWEFQWGETKLTTDVELSARFNSGTAMRQFVVAGLGLAVLPKVRVANELATGALELVMADHRPPSITLVAVYPRAYLGNPRISDLLRFLRSELREMLSG